MSKFNIQINTDSTEELAKIIEALRVSNDADCESIEPKAETAGPAPKKRTRKAKDDAIEQPLPKQIEVPVPEPQPVQQVASTNIPVAPVTPQQAQPQSTIPTTQVVPVYTYDIIAVAMAKAMETYGVAFTGNILAQFNAQSLMEIAPENYGQIALILQQNGVNV